MTESNYVLYKYYSREVRSEDYREGYVYIAVHDNRPGLVKVGISIHPEKRYQNSANQPRIVWSMKSGDASCVEAFIHKLFIHRNERFGKTNLSEWFYLTDEEIQAVKFIVENGVGPEDNLREKLVGVVDDDVLSQFERLLTEGIYYPEKPKNTQADRTGFDDWVTTVQACAMLNKSSAWLRQNIQKHNLEKKTIGRNSFFRRDQIEALDQRKEGGDV